MKTISIINYKGGVGKTTITANLAASLALQGKRILMIDLDPQSSLTFSFYTVEQWKSEFEKGKTIKNWYDAFIDKDGDLDLSSLIVSPDRVNLNIEGKVDIICSHLALINVDLDLASRLVGGTERDLRNNYLRVYSRLRQGLQSLSAGSYDFVLIDCPPNFNIVTKNAIIASDCILVPTKPDYLSTLGIEQLRKHIDDLVGTYNKYVKDSGNEQFRCAAPQIIGVIFTMVSFKDGSPISKQREYIQQIINSDVPTWKTYVRDNKTIYADAPEYGIPVVLKEVSGKTYENIQEELAFLTDEFLEKTDG
ncbi:ParA family protein [Leptolyngbya sp. CCY15150]|uniref:ParA family protein n=1 Tax=Leptolyngbya sp. CCY15150 TaxID=2767772 RepID=UPI00194DF5CE|nr:ParA family protein [Leptolyngbya sp. CCY15150]